MNTLIRILSLLSVDSECVNCLFLDYENSVPARSEDDSRDHLNSESESKEDDVSVIFPMLSKRIYFQGEEKHSKGNLKNKMHACFYCEKMLSNKARHLDTCIYPMFLYLT